MPQLNPDAETEEEPETASSSKKTRRGGYVYEF